jgi:hypothetical protein
LDVEYQNKLLRYEDSIIKKNKWLKDQQDYYNAHYKNPIGRGSGVHP